MIFILFLSVIFFRVAGYLPVVYSVRWMYCTGSRDSPGIPERYKSDTFERGALTEVSFGEWLKRQRSGRGLTQEQLAHQLGCATITLRKIEAEERKPSAEIVDQLIKIFDIPPTEKNNFLKFARGDWTKAPSESSSERPWQIITKSTRTNLPASVTELIGREKQLADIHDYLLRAEIRLVTLIGPLGMGKTRLSIEAARQSLSDFPDGVFFVGLSTLDDPELISPTVRQSLGYMEDPKLTPEQQLIQTIGDRRMLIVLDNCEHLVEDAATFASGIVSACSNLKLLATSRESLHVPGEWLYTVPPLEMPEEKSQADINAVSQYPALTLFAERAQSVRSDFVITNENIQTICMICSELDGLPLAIELIAAQMRLHSPQSLLQRMNDRFVLSVQGARTVSSRQLTLSRAIHWSYDSLTPDEQRLFAYLSVFSGGFTLRAAETMFSEQFTEMPVSELLASLLDKSLLQRSTDPDGEPRFRMLVAIRYFAADQLQQISETGRVRDWHLACFMDLAERADAEVRGADQAKWMDRLERELDNFRVALDWCVSGQKTESALRLLNALKTAWVRRGYFRESENWFYKIRELPNIMEYPAQYASLLRTMGDVWVRRDIALGVSALNESRDIWLRLGDDGERGLAGVLSSLGYPALYGEKDFKKAQSLYEQSLKLLQKHEDEWELTWLTYLLGELAYARGQHAEAEKKYLESLAKFRELGDKNKEAYALSGLGEMARYQGNYEQARVFWKQNLEILQEVRASEDLAFPHLALAGISFRLGEYDEAKRLFIASLEICMESREKPVMINCLAGLAGILCMAGKPEQAARLLGAAELFIENFLSLEPADQKDFDNYVAIVRKQLDSIAFEKAWGEGRAMTMEQAIAFALEE
jgi:predicted ATPase/DNA-binding XRE family transcriptional regulator